MIRAVYLYMTVRAGPGQQVLGIAYAGQVGQVRRRIRDTLVGVLGVALLAQQRRPFLQQRRVDRAVRRMTEGAVLGDQVLRIVQVDTARLEAEAPGTAGVVLEQIAHAQSGDFLPVFLQVPPSGCITNQRHGSASRR